jgi:hypothetical protein
MSRILFDSRPITVDVNLAVAVGLDQAIVIQQIHYWLTSQKGKQDHSCDGRTWAYNTVQGWRRNWPFRGDWTHDADGEAADPSGRRAK